MWGDNELKIKLLRKGILTRIYAPTVSDKLVKVVPINVVKHEILSRIGYRSVIEL